MFSIVDPNSKFDFMGKAPTFAKVSIIAFVASLALILLPIPGVGLRFGLDFSGGHEILVSFDQPVSTDAVRTAVNGLSLGDTAVQTFEIPDNPRSHLLVKVQRSETFGKKELDDLNGAFEKKYGASFKSPVRYNPEAGDVIEVEFAATSSLAAVDTSSAALIAVVEQTNHRVRHIRKVGRPDQDRYAVVLMGVDVSVVEALRAGVSPSARAERVEFVGPTVGKQLRNDGVVACLFALVLMLLYIALRFDFFYSPGAIVCLFHDAVITTGFLSLIGHEFSLATIAGLLTLIGYSINDTIVIFDRVRERVGKAQGSALVEVLNRSINETLGRTLMTSFTTALACVCLMVFGRKTVLFDFGLIMMIGVVIGTYSTMYIASPMFLALRQRFGEPDPTAHKGRAGASASKKSAAARA